MAASYGLSGERYSPPVRTFFVSLTEGEPMSSRHILNKAGEMLRILSQVTVS